MVFAAAPVVCVCVCASVGKNAVTAGCTEPERFVQAAEDQPQVRGNR